jgi:hypothetical protein
MTSIPAMTKTQELIAIIGDGPRRQLTLYELGSLLVVAGREAGFEVSAEYAQEVELLNKQGKKRAGRMDCVWHWQDGDGRMAVAWEIDAQDVPLQHLNGTQERIGNIRKFLASDAPVRIQALYSLRGKVRPDNRRVVEDCLTAHQIRVISDTELMQGKLLELVQELFADRNKVAGNRNAGAVEIEAA